MLGTGFRFDIEIRKGGGAYICGEETAIFNSIEGFRGEPRNKPPFPVQSGVFRKPTVINNVETLVNVLEILRIGGPAYARIGTEASGWATAVLPLRQRDAARRLRGALRGDAAPAARHGRRRAGGTRSSRRFCWAVRPASSCGPTSSTCR